MDKTTIKREIASALRKVHLLQLADHIMLLWSIFRNRRSNKLFISSHPGFTPPPYALAYDAYNHTNWKAYYEMGVTHSRLISDLITKYLSADNISICEWGCGPARVIRHLKSIDGFKRIDLYGTDYNRKSIGWCSKKIVDIQFSLNGLAPPLPYEDDKFDCVYAISIFTHLSEKMHYKWMAELLRVVKPGGIIIFTTHGDKCAERLSAVEKYAYDSGKIVVKDKIQEGKKHFSTYHPHTFIRDVLLKDSTIVEHLPYPQEYDLDQEVWVVRK